VSLVTAGLLGGIQCGVGRGEQVGELGTDPVERGHPDRNGQPDARSGRHVLTDRDGQPRDMRAEALRDAQRLALPGLRQQDHELLAAEPAGQIVAAQLLAQGSSDRPQRLVPDQMAVGVVDRFEVVDVDQGDAQRAAGPDGSSDLRRSLVLPGGHVEQAGLGVNARLGEELGVHHEPPGQQDGGHGEHGQNRVDRHHDGDHDTEVDLREVGLERLAVQLKEGHARRGIG